MTFTDLMVQQTINGLSLGAMYALLALGFTLVYGILELINFSHFNVFMIGSFVAMWVLQMFGLSGQDVVLTGVWLAFVLVVAFVVTMLFCGGLGVMIERITLRPLRYVKGPAAMITSIGVSYILFNLILLTVGADSKNFPNPLPTIRYQIGGATLDLRVILIWAIAFFLMVGLFFFVQRSRLGRAMRATAQDPEAARLMGINVNNTISLTFLLGGMLAGAAGLVYALYETNVWYFQGFKAGLIAFTAAVMGGIGNVRGAVLGGLIIGVIQALSDARLGPQWTEAVVFGYLIVIMVLRPRGLLGEETREAG